MKKIFLFAAALMAALTINSEVRTIYFTDADVAAAGELNDKVFNANGFTLTIVDNNSKLKINANNASFGDAESQVKFTHRLQTGGKSSSNNKIKLNFPEAGTLYVYARTATAADARPVVISQFGEELLNQTLLDANATIISTPTEEDPTKTLAVHPVYSCEVVAGEAELLYPTNGINIYALSLGGPASGATQGFEDVAVETNKVVKKIENGQVVIIKNGVKYNALGAQF